MRRRSFLIATGLAGGALVVGGAFVYAPRNRLRRPASFALTQGDPLFNAWVAIAPDGGVTVLVPRQEMGQGITTALPMLVAEELDCDLERVRFEQASVDPVYANATLLADGVPFRPDDRGWLASAARHTQFKVAELLGVQATGGSTSVRDAWTVMRHAGAAARSQIVMAAARRWGVAPSECRTEQGRVMHAPTNRTLGYGELAVEAAHLEVPAKLALKDAGAFRLIGKSQPRLDIPAKTDGTAPYGIDTRVPGLVYAAIGHCPVFGGTLERMDSGKAMRLPGVKSVFELPRTSATEPAVAVIADSWWRAQNALAALDLRWSAGSHARLDSATQHAAYAELLANGKAREYERIGDPRAAFASAGRVLDATYFAPYLAHATMEPMNCTAWLKEGSLELWCGNQSPTLARWAAAKAARVDSDNVVVHTPYLGGGFGRRAETDVVFEAATLAARMPGTPVQLIWSRAEDLQHDRYRPMAMARLRSALGADGAIAAWHHRIVSQSCTQGFTARLLPAAASDLMKDKTTVEGAYDLPYAMPSRQVEHVLAEQPVAVGFWRSVGHSTNAFFVEAFLDEVAHAAGKDPLQYRLAMLAAVPRHRRVLETAARAAGWGKPLRGGRGIALAESFHSIVAQVAEVEVDASRKVHVRRIVCAIDCGRAVNPDTVVAQMESGIVFGLSAALHGEITLKNGRVEQRNFPDYALVGMAGCPAIEVHIVDSGWEHLGGAGEPGTPPVAPAVANAIFAATGERVRRLPIRLA